MPEHAARLTTAVLVLCLISFPVPLPAAGLSIFTPTRENATGVPYLYMDPNTGAYVNPADKSGTVKRPVLSETELDADAKTAAEMKKYMRLFRYAYIGVGVQGSYVKQNGVSSSSTNYGGSMGIDSDGLVNPLTLELSGKFYGGSGTTFGETFIMVYGEFPISAAGGLPWSAPYRKTNMDAAYKSGNSYEQAARENWGEFTRFCEQFSPVRVGIGLGVGGFKLDQAGGSVKVNGVPTPGKTQISVAGIPLAARVGYFGKTDMVRLTGYCLDSGYGGSAKNGTELNDAFSAMGGPSDYDVDTDGKYIEARIDWYHRLDGRIAARKLMSGYGVSLVYRDAKVDGASTTFLPAFSAAGGTVEIPEARARQIELLLTIGYMR